MQRKTTTKMLAAGNTAARPRFTQKAMRWFLLNSEEVEVTYELDISAGISLDANGFFIGGTLIDLQADRQSDNFFKSKQPYPCTSVSGTLLVELLADGMAGDNWELKILVNEKKLDEFPIVERVDAGGRADHNHEHLYRT